MCTFILGSITLVFCCIFHPLIPSLLPPTNFSICPILLSLLPHILPFLLSFPNFFLPSFHPILLLSFPPFSFTPSFHFFHPYQFSSLTPNSLSSFSPAFLPFSLSFSIPLFYSFFLTYFLYCSPCLLCHSLPFFSSSYIHVIYLLLYLSQRYGSCLLINLLFSPVKKDLRLDFSFEKCLMLITLKSKSTFLPPSKEASL